MNKLDAVNYVLHLIGKPRAHALSTGDANAAGIIEGLVDTEEDLVQSQGWYFNTAYDVDLTPVAGKVSVPTTRKIYHIDSMDDSANLVRRNSLLWDLDENANDQFGTAKVTVKYVERLPWLEIPESFQRWIATEAAIMANRNQAITYGATSDKAARQQDLHRDLGFARLEAMREESESQDLNVFETTEARNIRGRRNDAYVRSNF